MYVGRVCLLLTLLRRRSHNVDKARFLLQVLSWQPVQIIPSAEEVYAALNIGNVLPWEYFTNGQVKLLGMPFVKNVAKWSIFDIKIVLRKPSFRFLFSLASSALWLSNESNYRTISSTAHNLVDLRDRGKYVVYSPWLGRKRGRFQSLSNHSPSTPSSALGQLTFLEHSTLTQPHAPSTRARETMGMQQQPSKASRGL